MDDGSRGAFPAARTRAQAVAEPHGRRRGAPTLALAPPPLLDDGQVRGWLLALVDDLSATGAVVAVVASLSETFSADLRDDTGLSGPSGASLYRGSLVPRYSVGYRDEVVRAWSRVDLASRTPIAQAVRRGALVLHEGLRPGASPASPEATDAQPAPQSPQDPSLYLAIPLTDPAGHVVAGLGVGFPAGFRRPGTRARLRLLGRRLSARLFGAAPVAPPPAVGMPADRPAAPVPAPARFAGPTAWYLPELSADLMSALTPDDVLAAVTEHGQRLLGASSAGIALLSGDGAGLRVVGGGDPRAGGRPWARSLPVEAADASQEVLRTGRPVLVPDRAQLEQRYPGLVALGVPWAAMAELPLLGEGRTLGTLVFGWDDPQAFREWQVEVGEQVAALSVSALDRAHAYQAEHQARSRAEQDVAWRRRIELLISAFAAATTDEDVARTVLGTARTLDADAAAVVRCTGAVTSGPASANDPNLLEMVLIGELGVDDGRAREWRRFPLGASRVGSTVQATRRPIWVEDAQQGRALYPEVAGAGLPQASWVHLPLVAGDRFIGWTSFGWNDARTFDEADRAWLATLADHAAIALDRTGLLARARGSAETIQRALLPDTVVVPGWEIATFYRPATRGDLVGGDWYDAFPLPDGQVGLVVGDVVGKGVRAAAVMSTVRSALRAFAQVDPAPPTVLHRLDAYLAAFTDEDLVTCLYLLLDPATGSIRWSNAGHPAAAVVRGGRVGWLDDGVDPPLGAGGPRGAGHGVGVDDGLLLAYTDGLVERRSGDPDAGEHALARAAAALAAEPDLTPALARLAVDLEHPEGTGDDLAILALRRVPGPRAP